MATQSQAQKKPSPYKNPQESLRSVGGGDAIAADILRQKSEFDKNVGSLGRGSFNREVVAFNKDSYQESHLKQREIQQLQETIYAIQREVREIKAASAGVAEEVANIERATMQALPEKVGIYHVRYYEHLLQYLRNIRTKVGEAKTWLMAVQSKKAKRGSAFGGKKKQQVPDAQLQMSQEMQLARSVG